MLEFTIFVVCILMIGKFICYGFSWLYLLMAQSSLITALLYLAKEDGTAMSKSDLTYIEKVLSVSKTISGLDVKMNKGKPNNLNTSLLAETISNKMLIYLKLRLIFTWLHILIVNFTKVAENKNIAVCFKNATQEFDDSVFAAISAKLKT